MHPDCLLAQEHSDAMCHHTWLMQCRLSIENNRIAIAQVPVYLLAPNGHSYTRVPVALRGKKLIGNGGPLFERCPI